MKWYEWGWYILLATALIIYLLYFLDISTFYIHPVYLFLIAGLWLMIHGIIGFRGSKLTKGAMFGYVGAGLLWITVGGMYIILIL